MWFFRRRQARRKLPKTLKPGMLKTVDYVFIFWCSVAALVSIIISSWALLRVGS